MSLLQAVTVFQEALVTKPQYRIDFSKAVETARPEHTGTTSQRAMARGLRARLLTDNLGGCQLHSPPQDHQAEPLRECHRRSPIRSSTPTKINTANKSSHVHFKLIHTFPQEPRKPGSRFSRKVETLDTACSKGVHTPRSRQNQSTLSRNIKIIIWFVTKVAPDSREVGGTQKPVQDLKGKGAGERLSLLACSLVEVGPIVGPLDMNPPHTFNPLPLPFFVFIQVMGSSSCPACGF